LGGHKGERDTRVHRYDKRQEAVMEGRAYTQRHSSNNAAGDIMRCGQLYRDGVMGGSERKAVKEMA
jgi:hypothetical protein